MKTLTFEQIKELLPERTSLYHVDYDDNLDEHIKLIQECIDNKNADSLYESIEDWYSGCEDSEYYDKELISAICNKFEIEEEEAEELLEEYRDEIRDHYYNVNDSDVLKYLVRNTDSIPIRISLHSNYDCINSHYFEGGYSYKESYFGDMVDVLNLNPAKVKKMLVENEVECYGSFPNYKHREGKELVSYADFWQELRNSCCGANNLVFVGLLDLQDLIDKKFKITEVTIPKGNVCGLFSSMQGGGSLIEMELQRDFKIKLDVPRKNNLTKYDSFSLLLDEVNGYSINEVYGMSESFWGNEVR